ncbi:MAG: AMP-binding protein [Clostridiaceae bacterium]|nr:AMP-binding protein [Clostridiaceae bacterium]MDY5888877.1 AMP-binding protein [Oscillospiraceae bacterium]
MNKPLYEVREFHNFRKLLEQSEALYGNSPAFKVKNQIGQILDISYTRFKADVEALGTSLLDLGLDGCKVAVAGANSYKWCTSYLAVGSGVGVVVPTDKELPFDDILSILTVSESKAIIFDERFGEKLLEHRDRLPKGLILISMDSSKDEDGILSYDLLLNNGYRLIGTGDSAYFDKDVEGNKLTVLLFTSGTTGMSKAVMLSADNICSDVRSIMGFVKINKGERILSLLPIHHTYECSVTFLCCIYGGVTICFCDGLRYITKNLEEYSPNILIVVPLILERFYNRIIKAIEKEKGGAAKIALGSAIAKVAGAVKLDVSDLFFGKIKKAFGGSIRLIISGAAGIDSDVIKNMNRFGIRTFQGYGLTECSPIIICNSDKDNKYDSIGKPIPYVEAKIDNPDENGVGEICVKGPMVMLGYYKDPEATRATFDPDGWFHTGDLGSVDKDGHYYIRGRCKSVIVTHNGKNVYPEELESLLLREAAVKECIVTGAEDERGNTIVFARIFPDLTAIGAAHGNRAITEKEISKAVSDAVKAINSQVVSYKAIRRFEIVDKEFEKTTTSKIKRNQ